MSEITEAEFQDIISNQIELGRCPKCGIGGGDILIRMPWYGKTGVCVKCQYCGHETKTYGISKAIFCGKKMATPFTPETIMRGILQAVKERQKGGDQR
jgi:hypothetical protein